MDHAYEPDQPNEYEHEQCNHIVNNSHNIKKGTMSRLLIFFIKHIK
jgi:hypothetical protein